MSDFKLCENGHYYPISMAECPYCPKKNSMADFDDDESMGYDDEGENMGKTQIFNKPNLSRTQIFGSSGDDYDPFAGSMGNSFQQVSPHQGRKLVGWLVSFTIDANGADFRLYEGRNLIGASDACDIVVPNDNAVSGHHLTILHRMGHFKFKDEFSTNGTFLNDVFMEEGTLKDGDMIKIGGTIFKFRSIA